MTHLPSTDGQPADRLALPVKSASRCLGRPAARRQPERVCLDPNGIASWVRSHHAGENRRGDARNRGCERSRFGESRSDVETRAGDAASTGTDPKTTATPVVSRRDLVDGVTHSRRDSRVSRRGTERASPWRVAQPSTTYEPGDPTSTVLYGIVRDHFETFRAQAASLRDGDGLPKFVEQEFRDFLRCGCLAGGFARFRCAACGLDRLVAFSC